MKKIIEGLKNENLLIPLVVIVFLSITIPTQLQQNEDNRRIKKYRRLGIATTYECFWNAKSTMPVVYYEFIFKNVKYWGSSSYNYRKRGDICDGQRFLVEIDSTNPENNHLLLDSIR
jgi:hypothetical protein